MGFPGHAMRTAAVVLAGAVSLFGLSRPSRGEDTRIAPSLQYLIEDPSKSMFQDLSRHVPSIPLTVRFSAPLTDDDISRIEAKGVRFQRSNGGVRHLESIYRAHVSPEALGRVGELAGVVWVEGDWRPGLVPCLNVSRQEMGVGAVWNIERAGGGSLTGDGIVIADFDTGIDVYHPGFWFADGDTVVWVDVNGSREFEPGADGADFNEDGIIGPDEILRFWDGKVEDPHGLIPNRLGEYEVDRDWLYRDLNGNRVRDVGLESGFSESDPAFGEPVFTVLDGNGDNTLDLGERLVALRTCKVRAVLEPGAKERRRGRDLIWAKRDERGHGTSVGGILVGESPGRLLSGIAPGAELLVADAFGGVDLSDLILWALDEGADVMLHELGSWVWDYMDGSSNAERMIDLAAAKGAVQVVAGGNLAGTGKHCRVPIPGNAMTSIRIHCPAAEDTRVIWVSFLWRSAAEDLRFRVKSPWGGRLTLSGSGTQSVEGARLWSSRGTSPRGTAGMFFSIEADRILDGEWVVEIENPESAKTVEGYVSDDRSSWTGGTVFLDWVSDQGTVTWPGNADSALTVASYATRGLDVTAGSLSRFSSRGYRIDGVPVIDLAAPGNYDIRACRSGGLPNAGIGTYTAFGGTSAAAAHAAGAAALILQANPDLRHSGTRYVLTESATVDEFTQSVPNPNWGHGKINALAAVAMALDIEVPPFVEQAAPSWRVTLEQNYPNPFNPLTTIRFYVEGNGETSLKIYDVEGRRVRVLVDRYLRSGEWEVHWDGTDDCGERVASGFYFCRLRSREDCRTRKMLLLE